MSIPRLVWDMNKNHIVRLYRTEGLTVKEVVRSIESDVFKPTEKQVRSRLKMWNVTKPRRRARGSSAINNIHKGNDLGDSSISSATTGQTDTVCSQIGPSSTENMPRASHQTATNQPTVEVQDLCPHLSPKPTETTAVPGYGDILLPVEDEKEIENWQRTSQPPYPELIHLVYDWGHLSEVDLHLAYHIIKLSVKLHRDGLSGCTIWAQNMPLFLSMAVTHRFLMSSLLALSACHLAWFNQNSEINYLVYHHCGIALNGLQEALGTLSKDNYEAILATSMLLSWQESEWSSWVSLRKGLTSVLESIPQSWKEESEFVQRCLGDATPLRSDCEDLADLVHPIEALRTIQERFKHDHGIYIQISEILEFLQQLYEDFPFLDDVQVFERLQPLRQWLFWLPPAILDGHHTDIYSLLILAHIYTAGVGMDRLFPQLGGSYFQSLSVRPIEEIYRTIDTRNTETPQNSDVKLVKTLIELPRRLAVKCRGQFQIPAPSNYAKLPEALRKYCFHLNQTANRLQAWWTISKVSRHGDSQ